MPWAVGDACGTRVVSVHRGDKDREGCERLCGVVLAAVLKMLGVVGGDEPRKEASGQRRQTHDVVLKTVEGYVLFFQMTTNMWKLVYS